MIRSRSPCNNYAENVNNTIMLAHQTQIRPLKKPLIILLIFHPVINPIAKSTISDISSIISTIAFV